MRIALVDFNTHGHHLKHAGELICYLQEKNDKVLFITKKKDKRVEEMLKENPGLEIAEVGFSEGRSFIERRLLDFKSFRNVYKIARDWESDAVHFLYLDTIYLIYLFSFKKQNFKIYASTFWLSDLAGKLLNDKFSLKIIKSINRVLLGNLLKRKILKLFIFNIYPGEFKKEIRKQINWIEKYNYGIRFLNDPIYDDYFSFCSEEEARRKLNLSSDLPIFLFFGSLTSSKGIDILFSSLKYVGERVCLIIAGAPYFWTQKDIDEYKKEIGDRHKIIDHIYFIPEEDTPFYFRSADAVLMPYNENYIFGTTGILMQACSARKPVICFNLGILGKTIKDNNLGILVQNHSAEDFAQKIIEFLKNKDEIKDKNSISAQMYLKLANWGNVASQIYEEYLLC